MGVKAVIDPQAAADSRRTFSPPTLFTEDRQIEHLTLLQVRYGSRMIPLITGNAAFFVVEGMWLFF